MPVPAQGLAMRLGAADSASAAALVQEQAPPREAPQKAAGPARALTSAEALPEMVKAAGVAAAEATGPGQGSGSGLSEW